MKKKECLFKIKIQNFKSIVKLSNDDWDFKFKNEINYLIGINESGKSNFLEAIDWISKNKKNKNYKISKDVGINPNITYSFPLEEKLLKKFKTIFSKELEVRDSSSFFFFKILDKDSLSSGCLEDEKVEIIFNFLASQLSRLLTNEGKKIEDKKLQEFLFSKHQKKTKVDIIFSTITFIQEVLETLEGIREQKKDSLFSAFQKKFSTFAKWYKPYLFEKEKTKPLINFINFMNEVESYYSDNFPFDIYHFKHEDLKNHYKLDSFFGENSKVKMRSKEIFFGFWKRFGGKITDLKKLYKLFLETNPKDPSINPKAESDFNKFSEDCLKEINNNIKNKIKEDDFFQSMKIKFKISIRQDNIFIATEDELVRTESISQPLSWRSTGVENYLSLICYLYSIDFKTKNKIILLLDEPDNGLHATAVIVLNEVLNQFVKQYANLSILIATHNPFWINKANLNKITLLEKKNLNEHYSTVIKPNPVCSLEDDENNALSVFLYEIGIDRVILTQLHTSINVFVEGFTDMLLLDAMKSYFGDKYDQLFFIPRGGASKPITLMNVLCAFTKRIPYFIFDYDEAGSKGREQIFDNGDDYYDTELSKKKFFLLIWKMNLNMEKK